MFNLILFTHTNNMKKKTFKTLRNMFFTFLICFVLPLLVFYTLNFYLKADAVFDEGYTLCGVDVSNLTLKEAEEKLQDILNKVQKITLTLKYKDNTWTYNESDFDVHSNVHIVLEELQKANRKSGVDKTKLIRKIKAMGFDSQITTNYVLLGLDKKIDEIADFVSIEPISASAKYNYDKEAFDITNDTPGQVLNREKLYDKIVSNLKRSSEVTLDLTLDPVPALYQTKDIIKATKRQGEFSTSYASSNADRKSNIKLAVNTLNGLVINPNETFSFNQTLGKRTTNKGYKEANIIKDGKFVKGVGGGICQVSTTLYNALLLSNIDVTEAHKHTLPVSYVPPCLDAMVSWGSADLKFTNTTNLPIYIIASANGEKIKFKIFGDTNKNNYEIKTRGEIIKTIKPPKDKVIQDKSGIYSDKILYKGEFLRVKNAKNGYEAKSYIDYYVDGKLVKSKMLRHATYAPQQGILYEGTETLPEGFTIPKDDLVLNKNTIIND